MKKILIISSILLFWLITMTVLLNRHYSFSSGKSSGKPVALNDLLGKERWAGIYQRGQKAGYTMSKLEAEDGNYRASELAFLKIRTLGAEKDIRMITGAILDPGLRLRSFTFRLESDIDMLIEGTVEGDNIIIEIDTKGVKTKQNFPLRSQPYINSSLTPLIAGMDLRPGETIRVPLFDPSTMAQDFLKLKIEEKEQITVMGAKEDTFRLSGSFKGADVLMWVTEDGDVLREESMGFTFVREEKEDAVRIDRASIDLVADLAVPINLTLSPGISYLRIRLSGAELDGLELDGGNQRLLEDNVLEIVKAAVPGGEVSESAMSIESLPDGSQYLASTLFIESGAPGIIGLADEITAGEKDPLRRARLLSDWVFRNIKKTSTMSIPRSTAVLQSREGDCNEHTTLYTALARASGIPTRMAVGLVYQEGMFYYHAWPEVHIGGWIPLDPTLGQFPADAAHIRLLTGELESQIRLAPVMGNLKLEGLESR